MPDAHGGDAGKGEVKKRRVVGKEGFKISALEFEGVGLTAVKLLPFPCCLDALQKFFQGILHRKLSIPAIGFSKPSHIKIVVL